MGCKDAFCTTSFWDRSFKMWTLEADEKWSRWRFMCSHLPSYTSRPVWKPPPCDLWPPLDRLDTNGKRVRAFLLLFDCEDKLSRTRAAHVCVHVCVPGFGKLFKNICVCWDPACVITPPVSIHQQLPAIHQDISRCAALLCNVLTVSTQHCPLWCRTFKHIHIYTIYNIKNFSHVL